VSNIYYKYHYLVGIHKKNNYNNILTIKLMISETDSIFYILIRWFWLGCIKIVSKYLDNLLVYCIYT